MLSECSHMPPRCLYVHRFLHVSCLFTDALMLSVCSHMPSCIMCVFTCAFVLSECSQMPSCCLCQHRCLHGCVFISVVFSQLPSWCFCGDGEDWRRSGVETERSGDRGELE